MNKCKNCNVYVYESERRCPLCRGVMEDFGETIVEYPKYKNIIREKSPLRNVPLFVASTTIIICGYINIFTHDSGEVIWSIIVAAAALFALAMFNVAKARTKYHGSKVVYSFLLISFLVVTIDFTLGMTFWSTNYVVPFLTIGTIIYLTILALGSKKYFSEYFGYILTVIAIDILLTVCDLLIFDNRTWGAFATLISSVIIAIGLYLFADKSLKNELKKRFHR